VQWVAVDDQTAQATLTEGPLSVTLTFHFDAQGLVQRISSTERSAMVDGVMVPMPWEVVVSRYETQSGMRVPHEAEVAWLTPTGRVPYWRGKIEMLDYELPR
jgi:predicted secreted hydrolase